MILTITVVLILILYYFYYHFVEKRRNLPPGPFPLPIVGNIFQLDITEPHKTFLKWSQQYGPIYTIWLGPQANVFITDYQLIKKYFIKQGHIFAGRPYNFVFRTFTGGPFGILFTDGEFWKEQRRFSLHILKDFAFGQKVMEDSILQQVDVLVEQVKEKVGQTVSLKHELELCVGNVINSIMFGYTYKWGDSEFIRFKEMLDNNVKLLMKPQIMLLTAYPWLRYVPLFQNFGYKLLREHNAIFMGVLEHRLQRHRQLIDDMSLTKTHILSDYTAAYRKELLLKKRSGEHPGSFSEWQLKMAIGDIWGAGMETTVTTLKWAILYMVHYPEIQQKCWREIQDFLMANSQDPDSERIKMADRMFLPYTVATVNEIQRCANLVPINLQHSVIRDTVVEGHTITKGTVVNPQISVVLCDPKIWPNPDEFSPDRFLEADGKSIKKVEELVPFSVGKRQCLGESLARMELFLVFATLVRHFKFSPKPGSCPPTLVSRVGLTRAPHEYEVFIGNRSRVISLPQYQRSHLRSHLSKNFSHFELPLRLILRSPFFKNSLIFAVLFHSVLYRMSLTDFFSRSPKSACLLFFILLFACVLTDSLENFRKPPYE